MVLQTRRYCFGIAMVAWTLAAITGCSRSDSAGLPDANIDSGHSSGQAGQASNAGPVSLKANYLSKSSPAQQAINYYPEVFIQTSLGDITVQLDAKESPRTVENFLENYVDIQFYDGTVFHYVQAGVMVIGGGYTADLQPKEPRGEVLNEADNGVKNVRGTIAMARHPDARNSATSQFFFNLSDNGSLDHHNGDDDAKFGYCVFGKVIQGMEVVDRIGMVGVHDVDNFPSTPVEPVAIRTIRRIK